MTGFKRQKVEISALRHCNLSKLPIVVRRTVLEFGPHHRTRWGKVMLELVRRRCQCNWCADDIFLAFDEDMLRVCSQHVHRHNRRSARRLNVETCVTTVALFTK